MSSFQEKTPGLGKIATIFACGAALFSDGYVNASGGSARYIIRLAYPGTYQKTYGTLFSSLVFAGVVVGQLSFGVIVDRVGRKPGMIFASLWMAFWSLIAGLAFAGDNIDALWKCLIAYRFLVGIGVGAEYPSGTVAAAENCEDPGVSKKSQQKYLVLSTNTAIDFGFVVAYLVPYIMLFIVGENRLEWVWRITLGFGAVFPLAVLPFRIAMKEPKLYRQGAMRKVALSRLPWGLIFRKYWTRLLGVCVAWAVYDWIAYPAGIYSSTIVTAIIPDGTTKQVVGWDAVINAFYLPGTIVGAMFVDWLGPKYCMITGFLCQAVIGFAMSAKYESLQGSIAGFAVLYGIYLSFGEFGPGNNLGVLAAKATGPTAVRGIFYSIAAAIGKLFAFIATYVYTPIQDSVGGAGTTKGDTIPVYIGSGLCILAAVVTFFLIPNIGADFMTNEDEEFRRYLEQHGYDTTQMGIAPLLEHDKVAQREAGMPELNHSNNELEKEK